MFDLVQWFGLCRFLAIFGNPTKIWKKKERKKRKQPKLSNEIVQTFFFRVTSFRLSKLKGDIIKWHSTVQSSFELSTFHVGLTTISKTKSHTGCVTIGLPG